MKRNAEYWRERFEEIEDMLNKEARQVLAQTEYLYYEAQAEIEKEIRAWYQRFAKNNEIDIVQAKQLLNSQELEEFRWSVMDYVKRGQNVSANPAWAKQLENASARVHISRLEALKLQTQQHLELMFGNQTDALDALLRKQYANGYYHILFELQKGFSIGWQTHQIDEKRLEFVLKKPWAADGKAFSEKIWNDRRTLVNDLHGKLTRNVLLGKAPDEAIREIKKKFKTTGHNAGRIVMTESAAIYSAAQGECFAKELNVEKYAINETLDGTTCEFCGDLDGKIFPMSDFEVGQTAPPFHPWCRGCTVPAFDDFNDFGKRIARNKDGDTYYVPIDMKYTDWKNQSVI